MAEEELEEHTVTSRVQVLDEQWAMSVPSSARGQRRRGRNGTACAISVELVLVVPCIVLQWFGSFVMLDSSGVCMLLVVCIFTFTRALYVMVVVVCLYFKAFAFIKQLEQHSFHCFFHGFAATVYCANLVMLICLPPPPVEGAADHHYQAGIILAALSAAAGVACTQGYHFHHNPTYSYHDRLRRREVTETDVAARRQALEAMTLVTGKFTSTFDPVLSTSLGETGESDLKLDGNIDSCMICLSDFQSGESIRQLCCKHFFHLSSLMNGFSRVRL
jgi:hypothetical protein